MKEMQKKLSNLFYLILGLPATAMGFGLSVQIAVLSWILRTKYNLDIHEIGIVWAAGPMAGILGQVIIGLISDGVWFWGGRRRPFIIIGGVLAALSIFALPHIGWIRHFLGIESIMAVAVTIALTLDLSINISFNPTRSIIADVTPEGPARTKGYTWMQAISNFFGAGAYLVGALFGNYVLIYVGVVVILLFSIVPLFFISEPLQLIPTASHSNQPSSLESQTHWGELLKLYFAHALSWLGIQTMFVYSFAFLEFRFQVTDAAILGATIGWMFFILNGVGSIWPVAVLEPLTRTLGRVKVHAASVLSMSLGYFAIAFFVKSTLALYVCFVVLSLGWAAVVSLPFAIMSENVNKGRMGFFMGIFNLSVVLPQLIVSFIMGYFFQKVEDKSLIYLFSAISLALSALMWLAVKEPGHQISKSSYHSSH